MSIIDFKIDTKIIIKDSVAQIFILDKTENSMT